jgi:hypothetical protein
LWTCAAVAAAHYAHDRKIMGNEHSRLGYDCRDLRGHYRSGGDVVYVSKKKGEP